MSDINNNDDDYDDNNQCRSITECLFAGNCKSLKKSAGYLRS